jgi:hypothetical protein
MRKHCMIVKAEKSKIERKKAATAQEMMRTTKAGINGY